MMGYTIITKLRVFDEARDCDDETYADDLYAEQSEKEKILGLAPSDGNCVVVKFSDGQIDEIYSLDDAIQRLAMKEGVDLVQWENGNYGYVSYDGTHKNGFEIIG